jgi:hypothetical protein
MLKEKIDENLKDAMRAKNQPVVDTLRMLKSRLKNEEIAAAREFSDAEISDVIASEVKRRRDAASAFTSGSRPELAQKEEGEIVILMAYMPEQLSEPEVVAIVDRELAGKNFTAADFGKAMGVVMPHLKGKASGDVVSKILKQKLQ